MSSRSALVSSFVALCSVMNAQSQPDWKSCPVIATLPAKLNATDPLGPRFELRNCGNIIVNAYEARKSTPTVSLDLQEGYPPFLVHILNVLVLKTVGGSAAPFYVISFHSGKPSIALRSSTRDDLQVKQTEKAVVITDRFPDEGHFAKIPSPRVYSFPLEY